MLVEALIECAGDDGDRDLRATIECFPHSGHSFRGGEQADGGDVVGAAIDQEVDRRDQGAAGGEHWIEHVALATREVIWKARGIGRGLQGLLIANHAEEADFSGGHQPGHAFEHAETGPQDRHDEWTWVGEMYAHGGAHRGADSEGLNSHIAGGFIGQQSDEFVS